MMATLPTPHRIGKLAFRASVADFDLALALRPRIEALAGRMVPEVLERVFDALAPGDLHLRLARLDLDLGEVGPDSLEEDTLAALESALTDALGSALHAARNSPSDEARLLSPSAARLTMFETYLVTGVVPFAERFDPAVLLHELASEQPDEFVAMLRRHGRARHVLERLVLQAGEAGLREVLALLAPADAAVILALLADVILAYREKAVEALVPLAEPALERVLWVATFEYLLRDAGTQFNRRRFLAFLLGREAARAGVAYADLLRLLADALARTRKRTGFRSSLPVVLAELLAEMPIEPDPVAVVPEPVGGDAAAFAAARAGDFAALLALVRSRASNASLLEALVRRLDVILFAGLIRLLEPADAELILAIVDDLGAVHRAEALPVLPEIAFEQRLRLLTLRFLLHDAGTQFNRRRFLGFLLEREADRAGVDYAVLLRLLADAVTQLRARTGFRASMPVVLAELLAELEPFYAEPEVEGEPGIEAEAAALAAARAGDFAPLIALLRARAQDAAGLRALAARLDPALFAAVIRAIAPAEAAAILADLAELFASPAFSGLALARTIRRIALRGLLRAAGRFDRREWRDRFIADLREETGISAPALGARGGWEADAALIRDLAELDEGERHRRIAALGPAALIRASARLDEGEGRRHIAALDPAALIRAAAELDQSERRARIAGLDPVNAAAIETDLAALAQVHAAQALAPLDVARFGELLWALAMEWLAHRRGARFDRRAFGQHLLQGIARHGGASEDAVAGKVQHGLRRLGSEDAAPFAMIGAIARDAAGAEDAESDRRRAIGHFLRTGQPPSAGRGLPELAKHDSAWLAALIRQLARQTPGEVPALLARLLEWLLPEELLECLAPGTASRALAWADAQRGGDLATWQPVFAALIAGEKPPFAAAAGAGGKRLDRLALIAHWLDHGTSAWWAAARTPRALLADLPNLSLAELTWLFDADDSERIFERLQRAIAPLGAAARLRLIARLAPWATAAGGPLASVLEGLDERRRLDVLLRAAAAAIEGVQLDMAALTRPAPAPAPPPVPTAATRPPGTGVADSTRLFAWLDGAPATVADSEALIRYFTKLADSGDLALRDYLAARRTSAAARARWAAILPSEAIGRLVHLLIPAGARAYLDAAVVLAAAWRQVAPFGARRSDPAQLWSLLLDAVAESGAAGLPGVTERLMQGLTNGDAGQVVRLRAQAQKLAQDGGHVAVAAALRRPVRPSAAVRPEPPGRAPEVAKPSAEEKALPEAPEHPIFIGNAGLVLLNPYLPALFERLGLLTRTEDGKPRIAGVEAQSRAVHLLQYMADERLDAPEPELALNKLLSGVAIAQPIEPGIVASDGDREICDSLIEAVIGNWPIIKNTSIAGLRETFLQRDGRLLRGDAKWDLHVQRKGLDVLVDQMPWTFSLIFHRWMADPVHVTW